MDLPMNSNWQSEWQLAEVKMRCRDGALEMVLITKIGRAVLPICHFIANLPEPIAHKFADNMARWIVSNVQPIPAGEL